MQSKKVMEEFVITLLKENLPAGCFYHNVEHTLYVMQQVAEIGEQENCTEQELELLHVAALWHDTGYIHKRKGHEEESCLLARKYMPAYGYEEAAINAVCVMIMATKIPQLPEGKLAEILADADLEYLGTGNADEMANNLFREWQYLDPALTKKDWTKQEIIFLQEHHYFTSFCKVNREPVKAAYLTRLLNRF